MGSCLSSESRSPLPSPTPSIGRKRKSSKKSQSSFDYRKEEQLHRIRGRRFLNGSSEVASLFTQQGKKGTNQDAMIVWENFSSRPDTVFCGVFDGHGPHGHMVAKRVRDSLPLKLSALWDVNTKSDGVLLDIGSINSESASFLSTIDDEEVDKNQDIFETLKESFLTAFNVMDRELSAASIDCFCSGTTAVTLVKQGQDLVIGNVGDSRAILGTRNKDNSLTAVQLTVDLKPNLPAEAERIHKCKERVFALRDEAEIARVWLPNTESPGLAMEHVFGDFCLKDFGLISVPELSYRCLTDRDEFVILATDGVWDVLSNEEVVEIVASAPTRSSAAKVLVKTVVRSWRIKYPTSRVDDCAVVCLFLDSHTNAIYSASNDKIASVLLNGVNNQKKVNGEMGQDDLHEEAGEEGSVTEGPRAVQKRRTKLPEGTNAKGLFPKLKSAMEPFVSQFIGGGLLPEGTNAKEELVDGEGERDEDLEVQIGNKLRRDAFLVFRALCTLSMKIPPQ